LRVSYAKRVETLFDVSGDFPGLVKFRLVFAIPSLAKHYVRSFERGYAICAEEKICTAVNQVSGMVTSPINAAIGKVNGLASFTDLNGMTNGLCPRACLPDILLCRNITPPVAITRRNHAGTNPFNSSQTDFSGATNTGTTGTNIDREHLNHCIELPNCSGSDASRPSIGTHCSKSAGCAGCCSTNEYYATTVQQPGAGEQCCAALSALKPAVEWPAIAIGTFPAPLRQLTGLSQLLRHPAVTAPLAGYCQTSEPFN
jgi:hypothetical protein